MRPEMTRPPAGPPASARSYGAGGTSNQQHAPGHIAADTPASGTAARGRTGCGFEPDAAPPVRTAPPPLPSAPPPPPTPPAAGARCSADGHHRSRRNPAHRRHRPNPLRCRPPSPSALPSLPEGLHLASEFACSQLAASRVAGVAHEMRGIDADLRQRPLVLLLQSRSNSRPASAEQCSQPLAAISLSSWPARQPA